MAKALKVTFQDTIRKMAYNLMRVARERDVSLDLIRQQKDFDVHQLDKLFGDGGDVRCEEFGDLAFEYAAQFGDFGSSEFDNKRYNCIVSALKRVRENYPAAKRAWKREMLSK